MKTPSKSAVLRDMHKRDVKMKQIHEVEQVANTLLREGNFEEAVRKANAGIQLVSACFGPEHPENIYLQLLLGEAYIHLGFFDMAQDALVVARRLVESCPGFTDDHIWRVTCYNDLGYLYRILGNLPESARLFQKVWPFIFVLLGLSPRRPPRIGSSEPITMSLLCTHAHTGRRRARGDPGHRPPRHCPRRCQLGPHAQGLPVPPASSAPLTTRRGLHPPFAAHSDGLPVLVGFLYAIDLLSRTVARPSPAGAGSPGARARRHGEGRAAGQFLPLVSHPLCPARRCPLCWTHVAVPGTIALRASGLP